MKKLLFTFVAAASLAGCEKPAATDHLPIDTPMPAFSVMKPDGTTVTSTELDLVGNRTVVVLFRTTCPDCRRELPKVEAAFKALGAENDVRFVAISRENPDTVAAYWAAADDGSGYSMPYYIDTDGTAFTAFDITYVPTLYLFGRDGKVAYAAIENADGLIDLIEEL